MDQSPPRAVHEHQRRQEPDTPNDGNPVKEATQLADAIALRTHGAALRFLEEATRMLPSPPHNSPTDHSQLVLRASSWRRGSGAARLGWRAGLGEDDRDARAGDLELGGTVGHESRT